MTTNVLKIDTNVTGLRLAEEDSIGTLPGTPDWLPFQPNSYGDTGSEVETVASEPINPDRMDDKGTAVDKDVVAAFNTDFRLREQWRLLQGFMFADFIEKPGNFGQAAADTVDANATGNLFEGTGIHTNIVDNQLILAENFVNSENNGLFVVTDASVADQLTVTGATLVTETGSSGDAGGENGTQIWNVGIQGDADELEIDASGNRPILRSSGAGAIDWTALGLTVGEWISIGGDTSGAGGNQFPGNAVNNTEARIFSISATDLVLDVSLTTMVTEVPSGSETIQVFWAPRILKNRTSANIVRRTYTAEQDLGVPDTTAPTERQYVHNHGLVPGEAAFQIDTASKFTVDYNFVGTQDTLIPQTASAPTGNRPPIQSENIFNTATNFKTLRLWVYDTADSNPTPLFVYGQEWGITINNGPTPNKAAGVFGAFDVSVANIKVGGNVTGYFIDLAAKQAVNNVSDVSFVSHAFQSATQQGVSFDIPLITLGDGKVNLEKDGPATIPLSMAAGRATKISAAHDYVAMLCFWLYLPARAIP